MIQATSYRQQVFHPRPAGGVESRPATTATQASTSTTSTGAASGTEAGARGRTRERSSARGSRDESGRRHRSSTRGSRKRRWGVSIHWPMGDLGNYRPLGWRRDLLHIVSHYYAAQVGPVTRGSRQWEEESQAFMDAMEQCRTPEWLDIKELNPLAYMGYVAAVFKETTGHYLRDLSSYTGWMQANGYYHWKVAQLGQLDRFGKLRGVPPPKGPIIRPSIKLQRETRQAKQKAKEAQQSREPDGGKATPSASRGNQPPSPMDITTRLWLRRMEGMVIAGMPGPSRRRS